MLCVQQHTNLTQSYLPCCLVVLGCTSGRCEHGWEYNQSVRHYDFHNCLERGLVPALVCTLVLSP